MATGGGSRAALLAGGAAGVGVATTQAPVRRGFGASAGVRDAARVAGPFFGPMSARSPEASP